MTPFFGFFDNSSAFFGFVLEFSKFPFPCNFSCWKRWWSLFLKIFKWCRVFQKIPPFWPVVFPLLFNLDPWVRFPYYKSWGIHPRSRFSIYPTPRGDVDNAFFATFQLFKIFKKSLHHLIPHGRKPPPGKNQLLSPQSWGLGARIVFVQKLFRR